VNRIVDAFTERERLDIFGTPSRGPEGQSVCLQMVLTVDERPPIVFIFV
jgi:hypothetical protein